MTLEGVSHINSSFDLVFGFYYTGHNEQLQSQNYLLGFLYSKNNNSDLRYLQ